MADKDGGLEFRDLNEQDDELYLTRPTSQVDLERRLDEDFKPDSDISGLHVVNPNPFGKEDYAGTDPIYQNYANETEKPYAAEEGADKLAEDAVRDLYEHDEGEDDVVEDFGMGGEAVRAAQPSTDGEVYLVPGQEGYPDNPEKYTGPAVPKSAVVDDDDEEKEKVESPKQPENQPSTSPAAPVTQNPPPDFTKNQ